MNLMK